MQEKKSKSVPRYRPKQRERLWLFWIAAAILCLFSPLLVPVIISYMAPGILEDIIYAVVMSTYDVLASGLLLAAFTAGLSIAIHGGAYGLHRRYSSPGISRARNAWSAEIAGFFFVLVVASIYWPVPQPILFAVLASVVFVTAFPLANYKKRGLLRRILFIPWLAMPYVFCLLVSLFLFYIDHRIEGALDLSDKIEWRQSINAFWWIGLILILFWVGLVSVSWWIGRARGHARNAAVLAGRLAICIVGFPLLCLGFLCGRVVPLSPDASLLLEINKLYDAQIDTRKDRLLVTDTKYFKHGEYCSLFTFRLDDLESPPEMFRIPTRELENIALDGDLRKIYHLDCEHLRILEIDADSFAVKRTERITAPCNGSTNHSLVRSANRLFVHCEYDNLLAINLETLRTETAFNSGLSTSIIGDGTNGVLYLNYHKNPLVEALDAKTLKVTHSAPGPYHSSKMFLSSRRGELYLPAPLESEVWVYSIPDLELLSRIPTQLGVRQFSVDDDHNLLIAGSYITGYVDVINLNTRKMIQRHYVGKYGRTIALDTSRRHAFMTTSSKGLLLLNY